VAIPLDITNALEKIIESNFKVASKHPKYWYPLATPTFGSLEIIEALESMVEFKTTMWDKTGEFEKQFGDRYAAEAIMVNSGSSADLLLMFGLNSKSGGPLNDGDVILVPAVTWPTQIWSIMMAGFVPRLVDVDPLTMNVDLDDLAKKIDPSVKGFFLVHLMGNPVNMNIVNKICHDSNLILIEDCCESIDAKFDGEYVGTFGIGSSFSFFFSHHITTMEGGMILTRDREFAQRMRLLRAHGWARHITTEDEIEKGLDPRYTFINWGFNVRPTELQASFGIHQIKKLSSFNNIRNKNAEMLLGVFERHSQYFQTMVIDQNAEPTWFAFPVIVSQDAPFSRNELCAFLERNGVETRPVVAGNIARQPGFKNLMPEYIPDLPGADVIHVNGFYIGIHPIDYKIEIQKLAELLDQFITTAS
jgi:CDP-6-deoxy-D-xylo-4-hexulose-3-dehydrase